MKTLNLIFVLLFFAGSAVGASLDVWTNTLDSTSFTTTEIGAEDVLFATSGLSVTTSSGKDFLVLSSFTTGNNGVDNNRKGRWQIATDHSGGDYSYADSASMGGSAIYERWINGKQISGINEYGSINMSGIYNFGLSGSHSFDLHHRTDYGADLLTRNGTMVVVSLNVAGTTLRHGTVRQDTTITSTGPTPYMSGTTSALWSTVKQSSGESDLATTIDVSEHGGEIFVAASMNCNKLGTDAGDVAGEWQLVLYDAEDIAVERLGTTIKRGVTDESKDDGAAMLYATTSDLEVGTYTVKLEQKVDTTSANAGLGVETFNASINAVALTLQDGDEAGQYFESFSAGNTATESNATRDYLRAVEQESFTLAEGEGLILAANFTTSGGSQTGDLEISLYEENSTTSVYDSIETLRTVGSSGSMGAGGVIGYDELAAGTYDAALNFRSDVNTFSITGANLVGFSTESAAPGTTSSGIDLRAYQAAAGVYVEFEAYDVEAEGVVRLALLGADGQPVWTGTANVLAGPQAVVRFLVPGLVAGGTYNFAVRDEVGKAWSAPGVTVGTFGTEMTEMSLAGMTLTFDSLPQQEYEIQWTAQLGGTWQTVEIVTAESNRTRVFIDYPDPQNREGFFQVQTK